MAYSIAPPTPLSYFATLVALDAHFPLLEAAASLAQDDYPACDVQQVLARVDGLLATVRQRIPADAPAVYKLRILNQYFFGDLHFASNLNDYYDPANSYLHLVLDTRRGIPISLAVLWLELAQGLGLAARGVGFPGHFLVKVNLPQGQVLMDPCTGESFSREELTEMLQPLRHQHGLTDDSELSLGLFLQAATPRETIARMLRNLKEIHGAQRDWQRLVKVQDRMLVLMPDFSEAYRDRGLIQAKLGRYREAVQDLETYLARATRSEDAAQISLHITEYKRLRD